MTSHPTFHSGGVLALRAAGLGDLLTAVPALRALVGAFPDRPCVVAAPPVLRPVVDLVDPHLALIAHEGLVPLAWRAPSVAVNLHGRGPQSHRVLLATKPARLVAYAHERVPESGAGPRWCTDEHEVARWCRLLEWYGIHAAADALDLRPPGPVPAGLAAATVVHVGAASTARCWPAARWAPVVAELVAGGHHVVLTGTSRESARIAEVVARSGVGRRVRVRTDASLRELLAIVAGSRLVVSGDTGVAHLAFAFRIPSVTLYGPTSPRRWGPPPGRAQHRSLWCGREGDPHAPVADPGLLEITVDDVTAALHGLDGVAPAA